MQRQVWIALTEIDEQIRLAAFEWLEQQVAIHGDVLPRSLLERGFVFHNQHIPFVSPQGIFKPRFLDLPLSITTAPRGPYDDSFNEDGLLLYRYRGSDPNHRDNVGLREAFFQSVPLVYFHGIIPGKYLAVWPVYIVADDPAALTFTVAADDASLIKVREDPAALREPEQPRRAYLTRLVRQRLHQRGFRERVLQAYREQCALCRLRHYELLDAAHIIPDAEPGGIPEVRNGIALCKLHHAAFDHLFLGITPDYTVELREDILAEEDGPMLQHGLKELHTQRILLPRRKDLWPDRDLLDARYQRFRASV